LKGAAPRTLAGAVGVVLVAAASLAAKVPDWAEEIVADAPPIAEGIKERDWRILLEETVVSVQSDGTLKTHRRTAAQAVTAAGDEFVDYVPFDEDTKITLSNAWHVPPAGKTRKSSAPLDVKFDDSFVSDRRTRMVHLEGLEKGSLVFFESETLDIPYQLGSNFAFYASSPTDVMRFVVNTPPNWGVRHDWLRAEGPEAVIHGDSRTWEMRDLVPGDDDPLGPDGYERAPLLVVEFLPPEGLRVEPAAFSDWRDVGVWYEQLARDRDLATEAIAAKAAEIREGGSADFFETVRAMGSYVRDGVRYVAKSIGIGGYQPHPASEVYENLYGDCKDKGTLFRSLLGTAGIESYPILIHLSANDTVSENVPNLGAFNHFVVGVVVPDDVEVPPDFAPATVGTRDLGRLLIVDTTNEFVTPGYLSGSLSGKTGLVVAGERTRLLRLPGDDATAHRVECEATAEIHEDHSVTMRVKRTRYGGPAMWARVYYSESEVDYSKAVDNEIRERWPGASLRDLSVTAESGDGGFVEEMQLEIDAPRHLETAPLLDLFPGGLDGLPQVALGRRETPVRYPHALTLLYSSTVRGVGETTPIPGSRDDEGEGWSSVSSFSRTGDTLYGEWKFVLTRLEYGTDDFRDLRKIWSMARKAASAGVPLAPR